MFITAHGNRFVTVQKDKGLETVEFVKTMRRRVIRIHKWRHPILARPIEAERLFNRDF